MRIIDRSSFRDASGHISLSTRLQAVFMEGLGWQAEVQAQEDITRRLAKVFGDDYVLVRNCPISTSNEPVPLILIGPIGVRVMMTTALRGTYRAKAGQWMTLAGSGTFKSAHPNLASRLRLFEDAVRRFVTSKGINLPEGEPTLIVARPETYIENIKTSLRVVLADGVENYATSLMQLRPILSPAVVEDITRALGGPKDEAPIEAEPVQAAVPVLPRASAPTVPTALVAAAEPDSRETPAAGAGNAERRGRLTRRQVLLLVLLGLANLCVLGALVREVVINSLVGS
ncbi:MAG: hypothetical protein NTY23_06275 [Chloroflexi bacterium]|nr:hypothetical protein [Chloroflexota bacterium]